VSQKAENEGVMSAHSSNSNILGAGWNENFGDDAIVGAIKVNGSLQ